MFFVLDAVLLLLYSGAAVKYRNPPVVETVLSVQYKPLSKLGAGQLGAYWKELGADWPIVADVPAIDPTFERFEPANVWEPSAFVKLSSKMDVRLQIRNKSKDRMIQIQNGRFFYNWLGTPGSEYPSYDLVRPEFDEQWDKFCEFVASQTSENEVQPNLWEVLYVNHMPRGTVWNELSDLPRVLTFLRNPQIDGLNLTLDGIGGEWRFEIGSRRGRLYLKLGMTMKENDTPCAVLTLTARGPIGSGTQSLDQGLETGHKTITDSFDRLTSKDAQKYWASEHGDQ
ncbi:MAG: TIGR04255 family protein [Pirellulales bacterium]